MASTYSNLKIQLMATGENSTTWGTVTNTNLGTAIEEAITGSADVAFSNANVTLTLTDTNATQAARNLRLNLTGTATSGYNLVVPAIEKVYIVNNGTDGTITVKNSTGTGIAIPAGKTTWVFNDGTNVGNTVTYLASLTTTNLTTTNLTATSLTTTNLNATNFTSSNVAITGGSVSSVNLSSSNVAITGGNVSATNLEATCVLTDTGAIAAASPGFRGLPQNTQTAAYTLALTDAGKHISITTGGVIIPANGSVAFPIGTTIVVFNNSGSSQTVSITTDTLRLAGSTSTGSRTLVGYGLATVVKITSTVWVISGAGVS